ncbi:hypothetical protein N5T80_09550 [Aliarcobacter cryaerophilus]|uniref:hypothetical protein n=1 Tax=Aliarcobacter cryaerophilus TaxID=28198 RepID=UPI0021B5D6BB|nr:hypothetical protein [Aliarcobacter cryaerophilus]MCT7546560.1 hypothetical protein [Aliarcobacter cryaerophilus]
MNEKRLKKYEYLSSKIRTQFFIILVILLFPLIVLYFHLNERANVIDDFNNNKELICNMSSLKIDVSKADNWSVDKNSFLKGSTSIPVTKCEIKD